jgi:hypothetical protein
VEREGIRKAGKGTSKAAFAYKFYASFVISTLFHARSRFWFRFATETEGCGQVYSYFRTSWGQPLVSLLACEVCVTHAMCCGHSFIGTSKGAIAYTHYVGYVGANPQAIPSQTGSSHPSGCTARGSM